MVDTFYRHLGERLRSAIEQRGKTYAQLCKEYTERYGDESLRPSAISRFCKGDQKMYAHQFVFIAELLGVSPASLLETGIKPPSQAQTNTIHALVAVLGEDEAIRRLTLAPHA